ncbi:MAG: ATP-dependent zinc metalloprotease FtsH [Coriobacteriia bacterium]|nr:ATP-dependent zinc metalloprotease FtsH [Coriobacteriia bacterium]MCL2750532.1 ATP-dependent zinc metalloprotease FtsH [Coriobacteriia bacterium]
MKNPKARTWIIYGILAAILIFLIGSQLNSMGQEATQPDTLTTSEFVAAVEDNRVTEVTYNAANGALSGYYLVEDGSAEGETRAFVATFVGEDTLNALMNSHPRINYDIIISDPNFWTGMLWYIIPLAFIIIIFIFIFTQFNNANNRQMNFGKNKGKKAIEERPKTRFSDVAGIDEAVEELQEIKEFLSTPQRFLELGAKIPRGVLLVGPPGTGKTLLARAVAGEAGAPFFSISGSDFVEMFVGVGASRVRDLFEKAKEVSPSIIFIDEIDAVGRQRGAGLGGGHDEREQTLNQLLVEMDGFEENSSVILIAATNRVDILDPALLRPGRFDRQIVVDRPDLKGREQILRVHGQGKPLAHSVDLEALAKLTPGFTGADLANLMNEAALLTARKNKKLITMTELSEAMEREIAGPERKGRIITDREKRIIAYHESGHALVGHVLENSDPVHKISIISRGHALGYTLSLPGEDRFLNSREEMYDDLAVFLGGRVAEELFCNDITTGASNDLERATKMARQMVTRYGMTDELGTQVYGQANHEVFLGRDYGATPDYSNETARRIDEEVAKIMRKAHERANAVLDERRDQMELMTKVLLERETVEGEALEALLNNKWDEYLENEEEILARKAEALRKQEEEDERKRAEAAALAKAQAEAEAAQGAPGSGVGAGAGSGSGSRVGPDGLAVNQDGKRYTLEDVFAGRVRLEDLMGAQKPPSSGEPPSAEPPSAEPPADPFSVEPSSSGEAPAALDEKEASSEPSAEKISPAEPASAASLPEQPSGDPARDVPLEDKPKPKKQCSKTKTSTPEDSDD